MEDPGIPRPYQQTFGAYPKPPTNSLRRNWGCLGYAPGVCWVSLRGMEILQESWGKRLDFKGKGSSPELQPTRPNWRQKAVSAAAVSGLVIPWFFAAPVVGLEVVGKRDIKLMIMCNKYINTYIFQMIFLIHIYIYICVYIFWARLSCVVSNNWIMYMYKQWQIMHETPTGANSHVTTRVLSVRPTRNDERVWMQPPTWGDASLPCLRTPHWLVQFGGGPGRLLHLWVTAMVGTAAWRFSRRTRKPGLLLGTCWRWAGCHLPCRRGGSGRLPRASGGRPNAWPRKNLAFGPSCEARPACHCLIDGRPHPWVREIPVKGFLKLTDVAYRYSQAASAFRCLFPLFTHPEIHPKRKLQIYAQIVMAILLHGSESQVYTPAQITKLNWGFIKNPGLSVTYSWQIGFWEHDIEASKMQGRARGRKGERKTYHITILYIQISCMYL